MRNNIYDYVGFFVFCLYFCLSSSTDEVIYPDAGVSGVAAKAASSGSGNMISEDISKQQEGGGNPGGMQASVTMSKKTQHIVVASVCGGVAIIGIIIAVTCYCKFRQTETKAFASQRHDNGYATYGVTGPVVKNSLKFHEPGDRKLAQSAQMYHYQYQKQQMIDMEKANGEIKADATDEDNEAEDEDDIVYQTCGLASSADLQIPNPMFKGDDSNGKGSDETKDEPLPPNGTAPSDK